MIVAAVLVAWLAWGYTSAQVQPPQNDSALSFGPVRFAGYDNYVHRDNVTSVQIVVSDTASTKPARFITAFPRANTGALVYFLPRNGTLGVSLNKTSVRSVSGADNQTGITGEVSVDGDFEFGVTLIGSVRTLRDYVESGGTVFHPIFNYTLGHHSNTTVTLVRNWINGSTVQYFTFDAGNNCVFNVSPSENTTIPPAIVVERTDKVKNATVAFTSTFNWTGTTPETPFVELVGLGAGKLFLSPGSGTGGGTSAGPTSPGSALETGSTATGLDTGTGNGASSNGASSNGASSNGASSNGAADSGHNVSTDATVAPTVTTPTATETGTGLVMGTSPSGTGPTPGTSTSTNRTNANTDPTDTLNRVLDAIQKNATAIAQQMAFLSYESEFLAGGWRFLTYFGRDTLIALRLLLPVISPEATEAILAAVIQRTNSSSGELCHEETIGDYASFVNMANGEYDAGNKPSYSYVMLDTDFLLLPVLAEYLNSTQGSMRAQAFLARNSTLIAGSFAELLQSNIDHVLELSAPFTHAPTVENLVPIREYPVGNWRDSNAGLGWGMYPFDVECALIPAALRAIADLAAMGLIPANYTNATAAAQVWEEHACALFEVVVTPEAAQASLENYVVQANLSQSLLYGAGSLNASTGSSGSSNSSSATSTSASPTSSASTSSSNSNSGWGAANQTIALSSNSTIYALSLLANGTAVPVLHSDLAFALYYGTNLSVPLLHAVVEALQPYPRGLLTNAGMVVANAAYDTNTSAIDTFSNLAYHGAVAWSWQQGLMAAGLSKQLGLCGLSANTQLAPPKSAPPAWCADADLTGALTQAETRLWESIAGSAEVLYTEVWSPVFSAAIGTFDIGDLGAISPEGTEGDAVQLWSYGFLALVDPRTGRPVAAGFGS